MKNAGIKPLMGPFSILRLVLTLKIISMLESYFLKIQACLFQKIFPLSFKKLINFVGNSLSLQSIIFYCKAKLLLELHIFNTFFPHNSRKNIRDKRWFFFCKAQFFSSEVNLNGASCMMTLLMFYESK